MCLPFGLKKIKYEEFRVPTRGTPTLNKKELHLSWLGSENKWGGYRLGAILVVGVVHGYIHRADVSWFKVDVVVPGRKSKKGQ